MCQIYLNKWAEYVAKIFSITVLLGATIAYWVLMSNFLYNSVNFIYGKYAKIKFVLFNIILFNKYNYINLNLFFYR